MYIVKGSINSFSKSCILILLLSLRKFYINRVLKFSKVFLQNKILEKIGGTRYHGFSHEKYSGRIIVNLTTHCEVEKCIVCRRGIRFIPY